MADRPPRSEESLFHWLALERIPRVGPLTIARLVEAFGNPQAALDASADEIRRRTGLNQRLAHMIAGSRVPEGEVRRDMDLMASMGVRVVTRWDQDYPANLRNIYDPPALLFVRGRLLEQDSNAVAVVGTRTPSRYGLEMAERITKGLVEAGITVVSGLARGIDTACHETVIKQKGRTIGVLGCGIDVVYPKENGPLMEVMANDGAVITEFRPETLPHATNFYRRNRVISGLGRAVLVVECTEKSGSLITVRHALDQNREVLAVPGNVLSSGSRGPHSLLKQGAGLVESADDVIEALSPGLVYRPQTPPVRVPAPVTERQTSFLETDQGAPGLSEPAARILELLDLDPVPFDFICEAVGIDAGKLSGILLELELGGLVRQHPGKFFSRRSA